MRMVVGYRGTGRTGWLLDWLAVGRNDRDAPEVRVGVFHSGSEAMRVYRSTFTGPEGQERSPFYSWQFLSVADTRSPHVLHGVTRGARQKVVLGIDNVELVLHELFRFPIGVVMTDRDLVETIPTGVTEPPNVLQGGWGWGR